MDHRRPGFVRYLLHSFQTNPDGAISVSQVAGAATRAGTDPRLFRVRAPYPRWCAGHGAAPGASWERAIPERDPSAPIPEVYTRQPIYYISNRFSVVGPDAVVQWPGYSSVIDFELEIAIIIGKKARTSRWRTRRPTYSATRSSTTSRHATSKVWKCVAVSARRRARALTAAMRSVRGSSRRTRSPIPARSGRGRR